MRPETLLDCTHDTLALAIMSVLFNQYGAWPRYIGV